MDGDATTDGRLLERIEALAAERDRAIDPEAKRTRGVVHTPAPIARFVAREVERALRSIGRSLGDRDVVIVDPATGPGVFLGALLELEVAGAPRACVGLDVDADAIARARAALEAPMRARAWPLSLETADALAALAPHRALADDDVVRVVIGNPPWAGRSANRGARVTAELLEDFRLGDGGAPLGEKKIGVLSDDYVRFLRWSCELVRRAERGGVIAMVTNASYLDGPVHRGMRAAMRRWMDRIEVIDLGGSSLVARRARGDGGRDENVFGVRPGVAIVIGVRAPGAEPRAGAVSVERVRGTIAEKIAWLDARAERGADRERASAARDRESAWIAGGREVPAAYAAWPSLPEWMPFHREGVQTNRDELVVARDREELVDRLARFARGEVPARTTDHWSAERGRTIARALLGDRGELERHLRTMAYRPLDDRIALLHPGLCHRPRPELARAVDASSLVLVTARKDRGDRGWACFGATRALPDNCWLSTRSSCRARAFPSHDPSGAPNLAPHAAGLDPERFACWALAWMACSLVREACGPALHADYPRVPPPDDAFDRIADLGAALARALAGPAGGATTVVGHHAIASSAVHEALAGIDAAVGPLARRALRL